jgi:hypothetical protein
MPYDFVQTPDPNIFQNIRFINDTVTIISFTANQAAFKNLTINGVTPDEIILDNGEDNYSAFRIFQAKNVDWISKSCIVLEIKSTIISYTIEVKKTAMPSNKHKFVAMTLFKDDAQLIPAYLKYYSELGIEHFYLYYNGTNIKTLNLPQYDNVTYIEWNYPYKVNMQQYFSHCAQIGAINDFLYWGKQLCEYILYNDLDEFIYWNRSDKTLLQFIQETNSLCYGFRNRFTALVNKNVQVEADISNYDIIKNKHFEPYDEISPFQRRSKCIVNTKIDTMGVHYMNKPIQVQNMDKTHVFDPTESAFYHIYNFKDRKRVSCLKVTW